MISRFFIQISLFICIITDFTLSDVYIDQSNEYYDEYYDDNSIENSSSYHLKTDPNGDLIDVNGEGLLYSDIINKNKESFRGIYIYDRCILIPFIY